MPLLLDTSYFELAGSSIPVITREIAFQRIKQLSAVLNQEITRTCGKMLVHGIRDKEYKQVDHHNQGY